MIIYNLDSLWPHFTPHKTDSVLLIDPNATLPSSITEK